MKQKIYSWSKSDYGFLLILTLGFGVLGGCAGKGLNKMELGGDLPQDISDDLKQKYAVQEIEPTPATSVEALSSAGLQPTPSPTPRGVKGNKKGKSEPAPKTAKGLNYPNRRPVKDPVWLGERQTWEVTYFGMVAGDVTFEVMPFKSINKRKVYHLKGTAVSSSVFSLFYRLRDTVESFMDYEGLFSHRFHVVLDETKQQRDALEINDSEKGQTFYWNRWHHYRNGYTETKDFAPAPSFAQDSMSALYYIRGLPLPTGKVYEFPVISEGKHWDCVVTVVRREMMDSPMGRVQTVVVKPEHKLQGILQKRGDSFVWLTDDDRRAVVRLEAKVKIGTVAAQLKKFEPGTPPDAVSSRVLGASDDGRTPAEQAQPELQEIRAPAEYRRTIEKK